MVKKEKRPEEISAQLDQSIKETRLFLQKKRAETMQLLRDIDAALVRIGAPPKVKLKELIIAHLDKAGEAVEMTALVDAIFDEGAPIGSKAMSVNEQKGNIRKSINYDLDGRSDRELKSVFVGSGADKKQMIGRFDWPPEKFKKGK